MLCSIDVNPISFDICYVHITERGITAYAPDYYGGNLALLFAAAALNNCVGLSAPHGDGVLILLT